MASFYYYMFLLLKVLSNVNAVPNSLLNDTTVTTPQGTFQGSYSSTYNITAFRKIPFGASTAGINRFRAPQPPPSIENGTVYDSNQSFDMCPQRTVNGSEDCLYLGLYSRPRAQHTALRPVLVVYYGGGFIQGSASFGIPPSMYPTLNVSTLNDYVIVYPNYRVAAFGFLPGKAIADSPTADLNPGLLDQQAALQWVHRNIRYFGGDPHNVTIQGQSAGGGSVIAQVLANSGQTNPPLFQKAMPGSPFWPKTYAYDSPEAEALYSSFVSGAGCADKSDALACLKSADLQVLRESSLALTSAHTYNTSSYTWAPVVDGSFLREPLSVATANGNVNVEFAWGMFNAHEGENFIAPGLQNAASNGTAGTFNSSLASFDEYLRGFLPDLSDAQIQQVKDHYPLNGAEETFAWNSTYQRAGVIFRDIVLACPAYWIAESAKSRGYLGEYTISPAKHGSDTQYWNQINAIQKTDPVTYQGFAGAMASFFQTGDPNAHKLTDATQAAVPEIQSTESEWVIGSADFEQAKLSYLAERCAFWRSIGPDVPV